MAVLNEQRPARTKHVDLRTLRNDETKGRVAIYTSERDAVAQESETKRVLATKYCPMLAIHRNA
jgi:hypothetical protein